MPTKLDAKRLVHKKSMSAIVPYAARGLALSALSRYHRPYKRFKVAAAAMKYIYRHRRSIRKGYKFLAQKRKFGESIGSSQCKYENSHDPSAEYIQYDNNTLYAHQMDAITRNTTDNRLDGRDRDVINLRGFKIWATIFNERDLPLYVNWAIVASKNNRTSTDIAVKTFRQTGGNQRAVNFDDADVRSMERWNYPLNSDKFVILFRRRYMLDTSTNDRPTGTKYQRNMGTGSYKTHRWYIPIKRQLRYRDSSNLSGVQPVFLIWWVDTIEGSVAAPSYRMGMKVTAVFREPRTQ